MKSLLKTVILSAVAASAVAGASADVRSTSVNIGDLDLSSRAGVETLSSRLETAAEDVCRRSADTAARTAGERQQVRADINACISAALSQASNQIDEAAQPVLTGKLALGSAKS